MKKLLLLIFILFNILILSGCTSSIFEKEIPDFEDYSISEIYFDEFVPSLIKDYKDISEEQLTEASKANILVKNISYNHMFSVNKSISSGSGVIFHETENYYYALTNLHVINKNKGYNKQTIEIYDYYDNKYSGFIYEGSLKLTLDLAILVFGKRKEELTIMPILDGRAEFRTGVIAIGNPKDERNVITHGLLKGYERTQIMDNEGNLRTYDFFSIIHTAGINSGSSGSMLINYDLKLIGINYADGMTGAYAVPGDKIASWLTRLINQND